MLAPVRQRIERAPGPLARRFVLLGVEAEAREPGGAQRQRPVVVLSGLLPVVQLPLNIAEGHGRKYIGDYKRSISHACGSCTEIQTLLILASDLGYLSGPDLEESTSIVDDVARMLNRLYAALNARQEKPM